MTDLKILRLNYNPPDILELGYGDIFEKVKEITILTSLAPGGLYLFPMPWNTLYVVLQTITWATVLIFLLNFARIVRKACR